MNIKEIISLYNIDLIIEYFNNNFYKQIKQDFEEENIKILNENINTYVELMVTKIKQHINSKNVRKLNILKLEEVEILFLTKIKQILKNLKNTSFNTYNDFYNEIKKINMFIDVYFNFNSIIKNIIILNNKYYTSNILSGKYKQIIELIIDVNKSLEEKHRQFFQKVFYKINGYKNLFPMLFFISLEMLLYIKKDLNILNLYLEKNMFKFLPDILKNPFLFNLTNEKKFILIILYYEIFYKFCINNLDLIKNKNISFIINNLKILLFNFYSISEYLIKDTNNITIYKNNFYKYNYLSYYEKKILMYEFNQYFKEINIENNKTFYVEELKIILKKINNFLIKSDINKDFDKEIIEENNNLTLKIMILTINYVHNFFEKINELLKEKVGKNETLDMEIKKAIISEFDKKKYEFFVYSEMKNLFNFKKNLEKIYNQYSTINYYFWKLYKLSLIDKNYNKFKIIKNNILYYIKIYSMKKVKEEVKNLKNIFYLSDIEIFEYLLKDNIKTEEILEITNENKLIEEIFEKEINYELNSFIILLLENFEKKDSKTFKNILNKLIENKWYTNEKINDYLKTLGIYVKQNPLKIEEKKLFDN